MSNNKMKGLLKGLRYISQIFDNEKESEMQIGYPTDVKHVAHIGWEGPSSVNSPSWMGEFKSPGFVPIPLATNKGAKDDSNIKFDSEDINRKTRRVHNTNSQAIDIPDVPKSTRRHSSSASGSSPADLLANKEVSDKQNKPRKPSRNTSKDSLDGSKPSSRTKEGVSRNASKDNSTVDGIGTGIVTELTSNHHKLKEINQGSSDLQSNLPTELPKKSQRMKSKDSSSGTRSSSRSKGEATGSIDSHESESRETNNNEHKLHCNNSVLKTIEEGEIGTTGIS